MQFINFMKIDILGTLIEQTQPWTTLWMAQPAEAPSDEPGGSIKAWAANVQLGNYSQVRILPLFIVLRLVVCTAQFPDVQHSCSQVVNPSPDAPLRLRFELFNSTMWSAESFEAAQPLMATAYGNTVAKVPLHAFGPKLSHQSLRGLERAQTPEADAEEEKNHEEGEWDAPQWFLPVVVCISFGAHSRFALVLSGRHIPI